MSKSKLEKPATIENEMMQLEERIIQLDKQLAEAKDIELLQQLFNQKAEMETRWEILCDELEK